MSLNKKLIFLATAVIICIIALIWIIPKEPATIPVSLPVSERNANRLINFEGIVNFRDIGGYATADGRTVKWGLLYRSGSLDEATDTDLETLKAMQLTTLIDFRSPAEKEAHPSHFPEPRGFELVEIPIYSKNGVNPAVEIRKRIMSFDLDSFFDVFNPEKFMLAANQRMADTFTSEFSLFMKQVLAAGGKPVVWHCTGGKDRTGFAAAILLKILGVPLDVVFNDYALSKGYQLEANKNKLLLIRLVEGKETADNLALMIGVEKHWLSAGFEQVNKVYGNFDNYVRDGLQLRKEDIAYLRDTLLENI